MAEIFPTDQGVTVTPTPPAQIKMFEVSSPPDAPPIVTVQPTPAIPIKFFDVTTAKPPTTLQQANAITTPAPVSDLRVRLSALHPEDVYGNQSEGTANIIAMGIAAGKDRIMDPLQATGGMLFPYTPTVAFAQAVNYMDLQLVHSNTDYAAYTRTPSVSISVTGKFTVQSQQEGLYALACIHFLRVASKSYFGKNDDKAGLPPPVLVFDGYGKYIFNKLRVVLKNHSWTFDDSADGIIVKVGNEKVRIPALFSVTCELLVVQTPRRMREEFSFDKFARGELMTATAVGWV